MPALFWALVIFIVSVIPSKSLPSGSLWDLIAIDKLAHAIVYALLVLLALTGFAWKQRPDVMRWVLIIMVISISIVYGIIIELIQGYLLIDRYFENLDILANAIGCMVGVGLWNILRLRIIKALNKLFIY